MLDLDKKLACNLKALRLKQKLSLDQLSSLSGVSRASISRIEKLNVSPTTQTLNRLCMALQTSLSAVLLASQNSTSNMVRASEQIEWVNQSQGFKRRCVSPPIAAFKAEVIHCELAPNASINYEEIARDSISFALEHHLVMLGGRLEVSIGLEKHLLETGDCLRYSLESATRFTVLGDNTVTYYLILNRGN
jgi:transcriptional regulator with XRE-family HTH domain